MRIEDEIAQRLTQAFAPDRLEVENESHRHAGHSGDDGSGESHFRVLIRAEAAQSLGLVVEWHSYPMAHQVCAEELEALGDWLDARFRAA